MKRKNYKKMKELGWDRLVEYAIYKDIKPEDLLKEENMTQIKTYLSVVKMSKDLEKALYVGA